MCNEKKNITGNYKQRVVKNHVIMYKMYKIKNNTSGRNQLTSNNVKEARE